RVCRSRPGAVTADSSASVDEGSDGSRLGVGPPGRSTDALGPGLWPPETRLHGEVGAGTAPGTVHADPDLRDDVACAQELVAVLARSVHERAVDRRECGGRLLRAAQ